jgi:hypothetical protein
MDKNAQPLAALVVLAALAACSGPANEEVTLTGYITGCQNDDDVKRMHDLEQGHDEKAVIDFYAHSSCETSKPGTKIVIEDRGLFTTRYHIEGDGRALLTRDRINAN